MASATGTITFSGLPDRYAHLVLNDGQGDGVSQVTFAVNTTSGGGSGDAIHGSSATDYNVFNGNASKALTVYRSYSTNKSYMRISFNGDSQTNASFKDMATGGSTPLIYEFRDADGNIVNVTLVNEASGFTNNVSGGSYSRKDSAGNYSLNTNAGNVDGDNIAEELKDILNAADTAGEIVISTAVRESTYYLKFATDAAGSGNAPIMFRIKKASGTWTSTDKVAAHVTRGTNLSSGNLIANISAPDEPVYGVRAAETGGSGELSSAEFAAYLGEIINNMPIQITATVDGSEISLANDVDGTSGNVAMSITSATNVSLSGMSGGSSGAGGTSIMARTRIGTKLIAIGGITKDNISSGSIESAMLAQDQTFSFQKSVYVSGSSHLLGSLGVAGATTLDGAVTLGNATGDDVTVTGYVAASVIPKTTGASDLGSAALTWGTLFAESGSFSDNVGVGGDVTVTGTSTLATVDIGAGAIDGTAIGATSHTTIKGTTIDATSDFTIDGLVITADTITNDAVLTVAATGLTLDASLDIALSADGDNITMDDGTTTMVDFDLSSNAPTLKLMDGAQVANYFSIGVAANGATTLTTVDTDAAAANLIVTADGTVDIDSAGALTLDSGAGILLEPAAGSVITLDGTITVDGGVVAGATSITTEALIATGDVDLGNATSDTITVTGQFDSDLIPSTDSARDLGTSALQWAEAHVDTGHIDTLTVTGTSTLSTVDINAGAIDGITLGTNSAVTQANITALTASYAKITSLDVDTIVSRTVTKDSLEIQDNLIIAAVSASTDHADYLGGGFQFGGITGVEGTGSTSLFAMRFADASLNSGSIAWSVSETRLVSLTSGSFFTPSGNTGDGVLAVTGAISASYVIGNDITANDTVTVGSKFIMPDVTSGKIMVADGTSYEEVAVSGDVTIASNGAVTIGNDKIDSQHYAAASIDNEHLADNAVDSDEIASGAIDNDHMAANSVDSDQYVDASVDFAHMQNVAANSLLIRDANSSGVLSELALATTQIMIGDGTGMIAAALSGDVTMTNAGAVSIGTGKVNIDNIATGSVQTLQLGATSVTKAKLHQDIVINKTDANGGLTFTSGLLSVGWRRDTFVRADGSDISGSTPTKGMYATLAVPTPYTTASLGAQPQSGSLMVYLNGLLLHGDHVGDEVGAGRGDQNADYHLLTGSANAYKLLLHEDLALDSDDLLTVTYLSGSGTNS